MLMTAPRATWWNTKRIDCMATRFCRRQYIFQPVYGLQKKRGDLTTAMTLCEKNSVLLSANVCICLHQEAGPICQRLNYIVVVRGWGILGHLWTIFIFFGNSKSASCSSCKDLFRLKCQSNFEWTQNLSSIHPLCITETTLFHVFRESFTILAVCAKMALIVQFIKLQTKSGIACTMSDALVRSVVLLKFMSSMYVYMLIDVIWLHRGNTHLSSVSRLVGFDYSYEPILD